MKKQNKQEEFEEEEVKLSFSRLSVILMYLMVISLFVAIFITKDYPPTSFIIGWMGFWSIQAIVTAVLQIHKRGHTNRTTILEATLPYINEDNANALLEKYLGVHPTYKKSCSSDTTNKKTNKAKN